MAYPKGIQQIIPGIIGGMGPLAHTTFEQILIEQSTKRGVEKDQEHPIWLLINATNIPDRTESLLGNIESCVPWLIKYSQFLESAGVDFLVIPCNTAHAFYEQIQPHLKIPWIHLIECTTEFIIKNYPNTKKIGILSTDGTLRAELYHNSLVKAGITPISLQLDSEFQELVMNTIYDLSWGIKATGSQISPPAQKNLRIIVDYLASQGAEMVIAGCSELSVGFYETENLAIPWLDPLEIIANVTLDLTSGHRSLQSYSVGYSYNKSISANSLITRLNMQQQSVVSRTRDYYNSSEVLSFQKLIYNNSDHCSIGLYDEQESIHQAMYNTVEKMAALVPFNKSNVVLDLGAGYGGAARYLVNTTDCFVDCLNLSEEQNKRNRELNQKQGLESQIRVVEGSFEAIPSEHEHYDVVWSQDALLFSSNRIKMLQEVYRVLKKGGHFIFADPMQSDDCPTEVLQPILERIHLDSLSSFNFYRNTAINLGFEEVQVIELTEQLTKHYARLLDEINNNYDSFLKFCGKDYIEHQRRGLQNWVEAGEKKYLNWGILHFKKPA